jgi:hypothetical protein
VTIIRITSGNFGLTTRLTAQVHRIMEINQFSTVTPQGHVHRPRVPGHRRYVVRHLPLKIYRHIAPKITSI